MGGKGKKKGKSKKKGDEGDEEGGGGSGSKSKSGKKSAKKGSSKFQGDMLSDAAMENAYYCCHNVQVKFLQKIEINKVDINCFVGTASSTWFRVARFPEEEKGQRKEEINMTF